MVNKSASKTSSDFAGNEELPVAELLADPIVDAVAKRDGITIDDVKDVVFQARAEMGKTAA